MTCFRCRSPARREAREDNFDTGKATIRPDSEAGHTDNVGTDAINVPFSRQRAESVVARLGAKGIDKSRLVPAGFGSKRPVADNKTEDGQAKNRRVDLVKLY